MPDYPDSTLPTATSLISDEIGIAKDSTIQERIDIKTSELRDSIRGSGDKTLTDLETDLSSILSQLDITLSALRDSLKGTSDKSLTDIDSDLLNILGKLDITLSQFRDSLKGANDKSLSDLDSDLLSILGQLDITLSQLRDDLRGSGAKTFTDVESDLSDILNQLDITLSQLRDSLLDGSSLYSQLIDADETIGHEITLDKKGKNVLSVYAKADNATTFTLEFSNDNANWMTYYQSASAETEYKDNITAGWRYWKLKSSANASGGNVTLMLSSC